MTVSDRTHISLSLAGFLALVLPSVPVQADWLSPTTPRVRLVEKGKNRWLLVAHVGDEFTLESSQRLDAKPGDTFEVNVRLRVDISTKALPELVCYDAGGKEIPASSALANAPNHFSTNEQHYRRVFVALPGAAAARARIRGSGRGEIELADLEFRPVQIAPYKTGMLVNPLCAAGRNGVVLDSNLSIVNRDRVSNEDRDGDGKWALVTVDLDRITQPAERGQDWRSRFEHNPNAIFWSDGAVLKSDTMHANRPPSREEALHFKSQVRPGPYRVLASDPGRAVAVSLDGKAWKRHEGGAEIPLGTLELPDGLLQLWLDACYRDPISTGPVYFDYVRLIPAFDAASVERLTQAARQKPGKLDRGSVDKKRVEITVQAPRFSGGSGWPVRCGLPIPQGELGSAKHVTVENARGDPMSCQARVLATWPDGSVKWLFLDFLHDFSNSEEGRYRVVYGNKVRQPALTQTVTILPHADGLEVDTGAIRFRVLKSRFGIVEDVRLAEGATVQHQPISVEIAETGGKRWRALDLPVERLEVEDAGPIHAVLVVETKLPPSGKPASGFTHRARIHAYAGSPLVQVDYFVANTDSRLASGVKGSMASQVGTRSIRLMVQPAKRLQRVVTELGASDATGALIQKSEETAVVGGREQNRRLRGWLSAELEEGRQISVGLEGFREQFAKAVRWSAAGIDLDLWAAEGGEFEWIEGVGKTHHLSLFYGKASGPADLLAHGRVLAVAALEWYCASGAFGPIPTVPESPLPAVERTLARHMKESVLDRVGLGFENYGDHSSSGYVKGAFLWDNNEYDLPAACLVHFARTGNRDSLRMGLASALHYLDVDTIHYSSRHVDWAKAHHVHSHGTFGHHTAQGPDMNHAGFVQGLIWYTYLTGEPIGLDGAKGISAWVLRNLDNHTRGMERQLGHPLMTLNDIYEATWDERWLRGSARLVDQALKWEHPQRSGFLAPITESPAYYSGSPFCGGLITAGLLEFNSWARLPEIDRMLERVATWTLTDVWQPGGIQGKGGSPRRRGDQQSISSHLPLMASLYERTGDPFFLVVPRRSLIEGFGEGAKTFGTRSTGLVFNYLPRFLQTLHAQGAPQEDKAFDLRAKVERITVARGQEFTLTVLVENRGSAAVEALKLACRGRLDFDVLPARDLPQRLQPGAKQEITYSLRAPVNLNLTCQYNRVAYVHVSALFQRDGMPHGADTWVEVVVEK